MTLDDLKTAIKTAEHKLSQTDLLELSALAMLIAQSRTPQRRIVPRFTVRIPARVHNRRGEL